MKENWLENGIDHGLGFSPDFSRYLSLDLSGHLLVCTAREEGVIIGFMFVVVNEHIDHTGFLWALITWYYVHPAYRGAGAGSKLLDFIETFLKERNVKVIEASEKVLKKHGLFAKRGYVETDVVYRKVF
jgi:GNAT superfamily N-acetyltransferase